MQMFQPKLQRLPIGRHLRGDTADFAEPRVEKAVAFSIVHLVITKSRQVGSRSQARLGGAQLLFRAFAFGDVLFDSHKVSHPASGVEQRRNDLPLPI